MTQQKESPTLGDILDLVEGLRLQARAVQDSLRSQDSYLAGVDLLPPGLH